MGLPAGDVLSPCLVPGAFCPRAFHSEWRWHRLFALLLFGLIGATLLGEGWIFAGNASLLAAHPSLTEQVFGAIALLLASALMLSWFQARPTPREVTPTHAGLVALRQTVFGTSRVLYPWAILRGRRALQTPEPTLTFLAVSAVPPRLLALEVERVVAERFRWPD